VVRPCFIQNDYTERGCLQLSQEAARGTAARESSADDRGSSEHIPPVQEIKMKPAYIVLKSNHYSAGLGPGYVSPEDFYAEIGHDFNKLVAENPAYQNTCAARMSLALIKSKVHFHGRLPIKIGPYKGRMIEAGAKLLADQLSLHFGRPLIVNQPSPAAVALGKELDAHRFGPRVTPKTAQEALAGRQGVVFFDRITGYNGGHIDLQGL
jgi:hypothetical protein